MTDFFSRLLDRAFERAPVLERRRPSAFEPAAELPPTAEPPHVAGAQAPVIWPAPAAASAPPPRPAVTEPQPPRAPAAPLPVTSRASAERAPAPAAARRPDPQPSPPSAPRPAAASGPLPAPDLRSSPAASARAPDAPPRTTNTPLPVSAKPAPAAEPARPWQQAAQAVVRTLAGDARVPRAAPVASSGAIQSPPPATRRAMRAAARPAPPPAAPPVQVTIGRIEVRAIAGTSATAPVRATRAAAPRLSLDDYLRSRSAGKR